MKRLLLFMATAAMFFVSCDLLEDIKPALDLDKDSVSLVAEGAEATFTITSNQDWTASADQTWVKIDPASGEASDESVTVTVTADDNPALEARTATITVTAGELTKTVAVSQAAGEAAPDYSLVVDKTELEFVAEGAEATFTVTSNQDWTASADQDWVELTPAAGEASDEAVTVRVITTANELLEARTATITVTAGELTKTVAVTQAAGEPAPEEYVLDGKQWLFEWEAMAIDALLDLGVTEAGKFYIAYDMGGLDPSYADVWYPYFEGTYTVTEGEAINTGVINLVLVDPYEGTELAADMPYALTAENAVTFDTTALEEIFGSVSVSATAATEKKELFIQTGPELPAEMDVAAVALAGEYNGNLYQEAYNYYFTVCDEDYLTSGQTAGVAIAIDLYSNVPVGDGANIVPPGEYIFDPEDTYEAGTFSNEYSAVMIDGMMVSILDGVVYVKEDRVDMELYLETGTTLYVEYEGVPDMGEQSGGSGEGVSTLEGDLEIASENGLIFAVPYGDDYGVGMDNWVISIYADSETMSGHGLQFEILTDGEGITGDYTILPWEAIYGEAELYNGFFPGEYEVDEEYMYPYGAWYMSLTEGYMDGEDMAQILDGELRITESDGVYTVEFDLWDCNYNNILGSISGEGLIYDEEGNLMASMAKAQAKNGRKAVAKKGIKAPAKTPIVLKKK